ncbi:hypothetical protein DFA_03409 [Cavenderia fasciculata]|uniref:SMC hinge domain-containing protein n=1 Tax=Cavenderia fasciculata TaxID=261658 RepID=F4PHH7_CACFS|nr:uncharacterized protein DFA_03409 [Cavenderia fasciculata]EGG25161.1 hypothetical protein DFA_03409 [Cavenderia fasciculata]|eukprot:XP_004363012.1 hypothetical protein DFA_03409 [Cavenderia fasciculata]
MTKNSSSSSSSSSKKSSSSSNGKHKRKKQQEEEDDIDIDGLDFGDTVVLPPSQPSQATTNNFNNNNNTSQSSTISTASQQPPPIVIKKQRTNIPKSNKSSGSSSSSSGSGSGKQQYNPSELVIKNTPESIVISRKGEHYSFKTPPTFNELKVVVQNLELIDSSDPMYFCDLSNHLVQDESSYQKFLTTQNNMLILYTDGENPLETPEEIMVDVTPSKNILLKAGTSEYNLPNAVAEFIDNSIQATRNNDFSDKHIKITIKKPDHNNISSIIIWDNGSGMNKEELQRWATMGMSQANSIDMNQIVTKTSSSTPSSAATTGLISRFGVGAKKSAFYLGQEITVITKVQGSKLVNQAKISLDILSATGDQEWKIPITVREASYEELAHPQFTQVTISDVSMFSDASFADTMINLQRDLAHIYYYYLHADPASTSHYSFDDDEVAAAAAAKKKKKKQSSPNLGTQDMDDSGGESSGEEDNEDSPKPAKIVKPMDYHISLNNVDLGKVEGDMESLYLEFGHRLKTFELRVPTVDGESSMVMVHLRYFPYINERETLPIPYHIQREHPIEELETFPLTLRKPGFEVFWNGRLISEAHIDRLGFMTIGIVDGERLEEKWVQRVKGAIFLGSSFPVTHNKMHIIKEHQIFSNLEKAGTRQNNTEWKKWLKRCHKMDQDFQFEFLRYDSGFNRTYCKSISFNGVTYYNEEHVTLTTKPTSHGTIKSIYFPGTLEQRTGDFFMEYEKLHFKPMPLEQHLCGRIKVKLKPAEFKKLLDTAKSKLPSKIKIYEGDGAPLPKREYNSGEYIKWLSIQLLDSQQPPKEVEKRMIDSEKILITLTIKYKNPQGGPEQLLFTRESSLFYQGGRMSFKDIDEFKRAGTYEFTFTSNYPGLSPAVHYAKVIHGKECGAIASFDLTKEQQKKDLSICLESPFPLVVITLLDEQKNSVPFSNTPNPKSLKYSAEVLIDDNNNNNSQDNQNNNNNKMIRKKLPGVVISGPISILIDQDGRLILKDIKIMQGDLGEESEERIILFVEIPSTDGLTTYTCMLDPIRVTSGPPVTMSFYDDPFPTPYQNLSYVPSFQVFLKDKSGNIFVPGSGGEKNDTSVSSQRSKRSSRVKQNANQPPSSYIHVTSAVLDEDIMVVGDAVTGDFTFGDSKALFIREKVVLPFELAPQPMDIDVHSTSIVQFTYYFDKKEIFYCEKHLKILPSPKPACLRIEPISAGETNLAITMDDGSFRTMAGSTLLFGLKVYSAGGGGRGPFELSGLDGKITASWDPKSSKDMEMNLNNMFTLPKLITDKMTRSFIYSVTAALPITAATAVPSSKTKKTAELKCDFSVQTTGGTPSSFFATFGRGTTTKIRCDSEVFLELRLHDKRGNTVTPADSRGQFVIEPVFELAAQPDAANKPHSQMEIKSTHIGEFDPDKQMYPCKLVMVGYGDLALTVLDRNKNISEYTLRFTMIEGSASAVKINGLSLVSVNCCHGENIEDFQVTICDTLGNTVPTINGVELICEWADSRETPFVVKRKTIIKGGQGLISTKNVALTSVDGVYEMTVRTQLPTIKPATVKITVKGGMSIYLYNEDPMVIQPNMDLPPIRIALLNAERMRMIVAKENVHLVMNHKTIDCEKTDEDGSVYVFAGAKSFRKAGEHPLRFVYQTASGLKIELGATLLIMPDPPAKMAIEGQISGETSSVLATDLKIYATDRYDNKISASMKGAVRIKLVASRSDSQSQNMPVLAQEYLSSFDLATGYATFPKIALKENIGLSEAYQLVFEASGGKIPPIRSQEFFFRNLKEDIDKKSQLEMRRVALGKEIADLRKMQEETALNMQISRTKKEQMRDQSEDLLAKLEKYIPDFSKQSNNPEEVKRFINEDSVRLEELKNRTDRRRAPTPNNQISREMSDLARSGGEDTGIIGLVMEIICCDNPTESKLIARVLGKRMEAVIFTTHDKLQTYMNRYKDSRSSVSFIAISLIQAFYSNNQQQNGQNGHQQQQSQQGGKLQLNPFPGAPSNGYVGHLVNRVQFREKHEQYRATLGWTLFRDTLVFNTVKDALEYRHYLSKRNKPCPTIITLQDEEIIEGSGFVTVGKKDHGRDEYLLGQLPVTETAEYIELYRRKNLLEEYKKSKHNSYLFRKEVDRVLQEEIQRGIELKGQIQQKEQEQSNTIALLQKLEPKFSQQNHSSSQQQNHSSSQQNSQHR